MATTLPLRTPLPAAAGSATPVSSVPRLTLGVEEEFLLADRVSRAPTSRAAGVIASSVPLLGSRVEAEFYTAQVETHTDPEQDLMSLRRQLRRMRHVLAQAATAHDCLLVAVGTPVIPPEQPLTVTPGPRYQAMAVRYASVLGARDQLVNGCHVHVGVESRAQALAISHRMGPWLATLQAITANSPYDRGRDRGYAAWRAVEHARWPTVGPAPILDEAAYERVATGLVRAGALLDRKMIYWYARPSEHVPTLEIRVADTNADLDTVVLLAALVRALAATILTEIADGRPAFFPGYARLYGAHRLAARGALAGNGLDPRTGEQRPAWALVDDLRRRVEAALDAHGDRDFVDRTLARLRQTGDGAARQRRAYAGRGRLTDVVDTLARTTECSR